MACGTFLMNNSYPYTFPILYSCSDIDWNKNIFWIKYLVLFTLHNKKNKKQI